MISSETTPDARQLGKVEIYTARINHKCVHCPDPIKPGEQYERRRWIEDDKPSTLKNHWPSCPKWKVES